MRSAFEDAAFLDDEDAIGGARDQAYAALEDGFDALLV